MAGSLELINKTDFSSVSTVNVDNVFSDKYDVYYLTVALKESSAGNDQWIRMRLIDNSGSVITASEYAYAQLNLISNTSFNESRSGGTTAILYGGIGYSDDTGNGGSLYVYNPNDSSSYTFLQAQAGSTVGNNLFGTKGISVHKSAERIGYSDLMPTQLGHSSAPVLCASLP